MQDHVKELLNSLLQAIECEREEERERHISEIKSLSPQMREMKGRALIGLKKRKPELTMLGDYIYSFYKKDKSDLPDTELGVGDEVVISQYDPLDAMNPTGIVYELGKNYIKVQCSRLLKGGTRAYRLDLFVNDLTYQRMEQALSLAKTPAYHFFQEILSGNYAANTKPYPSRQLPKDLNEKQLEALEYSLSCNGFFSVQGPPGTGKTYLAARVVKVLIESGKKVLICADSNAAVDNFLRKCIEIGLDPLRVGHPIRVNQDLKPYTLDYRVIHHALFGGVYECEREIEKSKERLRELEKPSQGNLRGLSYQEVKGLLEKNQSARGISKRTLRSMRPYIKTALKIESLYEKIKEIKQDISAELLEKASLIASTNSTSASEVMEGIRFDFVIVDEASQCSIPSTLIPILKGDRFILMGDHFQLPPVVISQKAVEKGLDESLMDYLAKKYPYQICMLERQYRMNREISLLVSELFYSSKLLADESVRDRYLDLRKTGAQGEKVNAEALEFLHVEGRDLIKSDSKSYYNVEEAEESVSLALAYLEAGLSAKEIAIITPYRAQVEYLRKLLSASERASLFEGMEVDTVDAFQGREKDLVIISSVRANEENRLGFLSDKRRLNVSISRAKKKMILMGSERLLKTNPLYASVIERIKKTLL